MTAPVDGGRGVPTLGLSLLAGTVRSVAGAAATAEENGFGTAWTSEFYNRSATITLAGMAHVTERIRVGSGIAYAVGRSPVVLAAEARDLDEISDGRLVLGLGTGTRRMMEDWHGVDPSGPATRLEELIPLLRRLWRLHEAPVDHEGRFYRLKLKATADVGAPLRTDIPVWTAGVNPRMVETAGRVSDGFLGHPLFTPKYLQEVVHPQIAKGAAKRERTPADVEVSSVVITSVHADGDEARRRAKGQLAFYAAPKTYDYVLEVNGFSAEAQAIRTAFAAGDHDAMLAAVTDEMVDAMTLSGTPDEVRAAVRRYDGLLDHLIIYPPSFRLTAEEERETRENLLATGATLAADRG
ncbi:LLM class flavin-dependent oxidoreductase [Patulibacter sp. S7RM1-6]